MEQLKAFKESEEMMPEMVKEAARRIPFSLKPMLVLAVVYPSWFRGIKSQVKVTLTIEGGWNNDCNGLEELSTLLKFWTNISCLICCEEAPQVVTTWLLLDVSSVYVVVNLDIQLI